jgi:phosphoribosyl 1,2-cyclic phosphodiesterase
VRFASLGSGSRGNSLLVEVGRARVLIDAGFGPRETQRRLARLGVEPNEIDAILITHEHADHIGGARACANRFAWRTLATAGTQAVARAGQADAGFEIIDSHRAFSLGDVLVEPFPVPHDAREPVQFVLGDGAKRLGILTDAGHVTPHMIAMLDGCDAIVLECNHDLDLLAMGRYPQALKRRIAGLHGHLDNHAAGGLLSRIDRTRLRHVIAAHLSEQNNTPELARAALCRPLGCEPKWIGVATQNEGFDWRVL